MACEHDWDGTFEVKSPEGWKHTFLRCVRCGATSSVRRTHGVIEESGVIVESASVR